MPDVSIGKSVSRLQSADVYGQCARRIKRYKYRRYTNITTPSIHGFAGTDISPYEKLVSLERDERRSLRKDGFRRNGTSHVPYERMASPERDEPRSLRMMASPERDEPRSLRMMALPERAVHVSYEKMASPYKRLAH